MENAYQKDISFIIQTLQTDPIYGLSNQEVLERVKKYGLNKLDETKPPSWIAIFFSQFASPLIYILVFAASLIFLVADDKIDAFIILGILLFNAIVGTIQEGRTRKILISLKEFIIQETIVIRDGKKLLISNTQLVPGDIAIIQAGQRVPADVRVIESHNARVDEALLTGESGSVHKSNVVYDKDVPLIDRKNMLYSGTYMLSGWAQVVVVATGMQTEIGKIQKSVQEIQTEVPLVQEMQYLSWWIVTFIFVTCLFLLSIGLWINTPLKDLVIVLTALFICVIPEGLPVVLTLVLVTGVYRMAKQKVLVKNMQAVEGLGHAQVIVIDKTGTLTRNEMIVTHLFVDEQVVTISGKGYYPEGSLFSNGKQLVVQPESDLYLLAQGLRLINSSTITFVHQRGTFDIKGDPTEAALYVAAQKIPINEQTLMHYKKIYEIPFDSEYRYHAGFYEYKGTGIAFVAGSPEAIKLRAQKTFPDTVMQQFFQEGLRLVAVATKRFDLKKIEHNNEHDELLFYRKVIDSELVPLALCGIEDSIRSQASTMVSKARKAGLHIIMATGDHQRTALAIAKQVGIYKEGDEAIDGPELQAMSNEQLSEVIKHATVFSRVIPDQKLRIIEALHKHGLTVAMTGDGINDAPSLVAADIGIAMGSIGTEIAKSASDIILLDDSFVNIINAIEEGRHIIYTLRRVILYFFSTNCAEILILFFTFLMSLFNPKISLIFPLTAAQILWLNLITDGFLDTALAMEKKEQGLLYQEQWTAKKQLKLIDAGLFWHMIWAAVPMALGSLVVFLLYRPYNIDLARTMTLVTLGMFQWFNAWNCRSITLSMGQLGFLSNKWLILATMVVASLQLLLLHVPFLQSIFGTMPLNIYQWVFAALIAFSIVILEELRKWYVRRYARMD